MNYYFKFKPYNSMKIPKALSFLQEENKLKIFLKNINPLIKKHNNYLYFTFDKNNVFYHEIKKRVINS